MPEDKEKFAGGTSLDMRDKNAAASREKAEGVVDESVDERMKIASTGGTKKVKVTGKGKKGVVKGTQGGLVERLNLTKPEKEEYDGLDGEAKELYIIRKKIERNHYLDKKDQFEVSREEELKVGAGGPTPGPVS
jgi:hypothetical protein